MKYQQKIIFVSYELLALDKDEEGYVPFKKIRKRIEKAIKLSEECRVFFIPPKEANEKATKLIKAGLKISGYPARQVTPEVLPEVVNVHPNYAFIIFTSQKQLASLEQLIVEPLEKKYRRRGFFGFRFTEWKEPRKAYVNPYILYPARPFRNLNIMQRW